MKILLFQVRNGALETRRSMSVWYPQNSSTLSKVMTSFSKSAQLSLGPVALGVFVNHKVHGIHEWVLDIEVFGIVENGQRFLSVHR